jgi:hypothetical protein
MDVEMMHKKEDNAHGLFWRLAAHTVVVSSTKETSPPPYSLLLAPICYSATVTISDNY